jgi:hypothetical protein
MKRRHFIILAAALPAAAQRQSRGAAPADDILLRALRDELQRSLELRIMAGSPPYYIEYGLEDLDSFSVNASLGAIIAKSESRIRFPRVQVRVGDYNFDNTNYVYSDFFSTSRVGSARVPLDDDYALVRRIFWLATDRVYKGAVEGLARKQAALKNITQQEQLEDFAKAEPVKMVLPLERPAFSGQPWMERVKTLSGLFAQFPKVLSSDVEMNAGRTNSYYLNSEGFESRFPDDLYTVRIRAASQAPDGMPVRDGAVFEARTPSALPNQTELERRTLEVGRNVTALASAPMGEDYSGPVLLEGLASAQLFAQLLGANLGLPRRPVIEPGRMPPLPSSELEGRLGSRIMPEWFDVVDDPTQKEYRAHELLGYYPVDMEGVVPTPVTVIEKGVVKAFLLTRQPVRGFSGSNGRARLPGAFGGKFASFSNLFVKARETAPEADLKKRLLEMIQQRGKPYGLLLRKLDYPTTSNSEELRRLSMASSQRGGSARIVSPPVLAFRVYPDGREELVRGLRFRALNVRSLRDIVAASDTEHFFDFIGAVAATPGTSPSGFVTTHTVVAPSVLFEDMELDRREEDWPKPPIVPPPTLITSR